MDELMIYARCSRDVLDCENPNDAREHIKRELIDVMHDAWHLNSKNGDIFAMPARNRSDWFSTFGSYGIHPTKDGVNVNDIHKHLFEMTIDGDSPSVGDVTSLSKLSVNFWSDVFNNELSFMDSLLLFSHFDLLNVDHDVFGDMCVAMNECQFNTIDPNYRNVWVKMVGKYFVYGKNGWASSIYKKAYLYYPGKKAILMPAGKIAALVPKSLFNYSVDYKYKSILDCHDQFEFDGDFYVRALGGYIKTKVPEADLQLSYHPVVSTRYPSLSGRSQAAACFPWVRAKRISNNQVGMARLRVK